MKFVQVGKLAVNLSLTVAIEFEPGYIKLWDPGGGEDRIAYLRGKGADVFRNWWGTESFHHWMESESTLYRLEVR
jgi:hypothetical protein